MNPVDILRRVTRPMTDAEVEREHEQRFGPLYARENVGLDDAVHLRNLASADEKARWPTGEPPHKGD